MAIAIDTTACGVIRTSVLGRKGAGEESVDSVLSEEEGLGLQ